MTILTLRTDKPKAELGLFAANKEIDSISWQAHRQLAETIHSKIAELLNINGLSLEDLQGIVLYKGPGSFTGLRIGASVANALAYSLQVPVVGRSGEDWQAEGIMSISKKENNKIVLPEYGAPVHITQQKK